MTNGDSDTQRGSGGIVGDEVFFDDFAYRDSTDQRLLPRGWTVRSDPGGPGVSCATWSTAAVTFPMVDGRQVLQLESSTDGTAAGTVHAEVFQQRTFREGTYAARVWFSGWPSTLKPRSAAATRDGTSC